MYPSKLVFTIFKLDWPMGGVINRPENGWELNNQLHGNRVVNREHLTSFDKCNYKIANKKNKC